MAGQIQTAIGQVLGASAASLLVAKKVRDDERQVRENEQKAAEKESKAAEKEAKAAAKEKAKAVKTAQDKGVDSPSTILFDKAGKPIATYEEMAELLSSEKTSATLTSNLRTLVATRERRKVLEAKAAIKAKEKAPESKEEK